MPQRHSRDLRRIRMDVGGDRGHARPRPHVRHRQPADRPCRNRQNGQINQRRPHIHPIPRTQRKKILGKWPMVAIDLLRKRRTHQRGHRQTIHTNPKGTSLERRFLPAHKRRGNPHLTNLEAPPCSLTHLPSGSLACKGLYIPPPISFSIRIGYRRIRCHR